MCRFSRDLNFTPGTIQQLSCPISTWGGTRQTGGASCYCTLEHSGVTSLPAPIRDDKEQDRPWDPYPFILLNLALSFQAAYAAPFIMMSQNRQADKDRLAAEHDYCVNIRSDLRIAAVLSHLEAQDDVILTILRQLERVHHTDPDEEQQKAEARLRESQEYERRMLQKVIISEEQKAGLTPIDS